MITLDDLDPLAPQPAPRSRLGARWGMVTQTSPLRVRLDGDATPIPYTPVTLAQVGVGSRVLCLLLGRQLIVLGTTRAPIAVAGVAAKTAGFQSLAGGDWVGLTEAWVSGGVTWNAQQGGGLMVPTSGVWRISTLAYWSGAPGAGVVNVVRRRGSTNVDIARVFTIKATDEDVTSSYAGPHQLQAGDFVSLYGKSDTTRIWGADGLGTRLSIEKI